MVGNVVGLILPLVAAMVVGYGLWAAFLVGAFGYFASFVIGLKLDEVTRESHPPAPDPEPESALRYVFADAPPVATEGSPAEGGRAEGSPNGQADLDAGELESTGGEATPAVPPAEGA